MHLASIILISSPVAALSDAIPMNVRSRENIHKYDSSQTHPSIDLSKFLKPWNVTMGPPPRGWYKAKFYFDSRESVDNNDIIKKSGENGLTKSTFNFEEFAKEHYCRYRNEKESNNQCCDSEDQNCYTQAGCYCDKACFEIYGDCCTDHFVTCYDDLKLCLKKSTKDDKGPKDRNAYFDGTKGNHDGPRPMEHDVGLGPNPGHVEPDSCCGQEEYNAGEKCCHEVDNRRKVSPAGTCVVEEAETGDEVDDRLFDSPEPADVATNVVYDDEE